MITFEVLVGNHVPFPMVVEYANLATTAFLLQNSDPVKQFRVLQSDAILTPMSTGLSARNFSKWRAKFDYSQR